MPINMSQNTEVFNQEIAELEAKLAAKKQELMNSGAEHTEKAVFQQVVKEHASGEALSPAIPVATAPTSSATSTQVVTPAVQAKINSLIAHAFTKGLAAAISEAKKTGDAYFIDLLHDQLADQYFEKLLQARKINSQ